MEDILLILVVIAAVVFGYFIICRLDSFLENNSQQIKKKIRSEDLEENESAACVMLTDELSDEEIAGELRRFRKSHNNTRILIYEENAGGTDIISDQKQ